MVTDDPITPTMMTTVLDEIGKKPDQKVEEIGELPKHLFFSNEDLLIIKKEQKAERRRKKAALRKMMRKLTPKANKAKNKTSSSASSTKNLGIMEGGAEGGSIRTYYEKVYESYLKLLMQPYQIDCVFCFHCSNYYYYGDTNIYPKRCQVCNSNYCKSNKTTYVDTKVPNNVVGRSHLARPDFILDYNTIEDRTRYKKDTRRNKPEDIIKYQKEYLKKVGIIRIDGGVHKEHSVMKKDYNQYRDFRDRGVKVFIIKNEQIDELMTRGDNGKSLLKLCHDIGNAVIDEELYIKYTQDRDFQEYTSKPF